MTTTATSAGSVSQSSKLITTLEDLQEMVAIVKGNIHIGGAKSDQSVTFAQIGAGKDQGKLFLYNRMNFKYMAVDCDGPVLPHEKRVGGMELGPKRPNIKLILSPQQMEYHFQIMLDQMVRAAYEFNKTKLRETFPELVTFSFQDVTIAPTRATPKGKIGYEVIVVTSDGGMIPLSNFLPSSPNEAQSGAIQLLEKDKRIIETECQNEEGKSYKTFVFSDLDPKIDPKTKKLYQEMNLTHSSYPDGIRHYRSAQNAYRPSMSDIHQWGIVIPRMVQNDKGGYNFDPSTDWCKEPGFRAITKAGERNPFVGRVGFSVDSVMEGSGHVKVWYRCQVWRMPQASNAGSDDFGEEAIAVPTGAAVSLSTQSKAMAGNTVLSGIMQLGEGDEV